MQIEHRKEPGVTDLVREAAEEIRELVRVETALAREELKREVKHAKTAAIGFGVAAAFAIAALSLLLVALALAIDLGALSVFVVGLVSLCVAAGVGFAAYRMLPKKPLEPTKERVQRDLRMLKEHVA
jgi:uncharacterized membrane protein YqjE